MSWYEKNALSNILLKAFEPYVKGGEDHNYKNILQKFFTGYIKQLSTQKSFDEIKEEVRKFIKLIPKPSERLIDSILELYEDISPLEKAKFYDEFLGYRHQKEEKLKELYRELENKTIKSA